jgi:hypothetical protein
MMDRLESLLGRRADRATARPPASGRARLVALIRLEPSSDLMLEPESPA